MSNEKIVYETESSRYNSGQYRVEALRDPRDYRWAYDGQYETEAEARARANYLVEVGGRYQARVVKEQETIKGE